MLFSALVLLCAVVLLPSCGDEPDMGKNSLPAMSEKLLGMTQTEAENYLKKNDYTFYGMAQDKITYCYTRGNNEAYPGGVEEEISFFLLDDVVVYTNFTRFFSTVADATDYYRDYSVYTRKHIIKEFDCWSGYMSWKTDGTKNHREYYELTKQSEDFEPEYGRDDFDKDMKTLDGIYDISEKYYREKSPKEFIMYLNSSDDELSVFGQNYNFHFSWQPEQQKTTSPLP